MPGAKSESWRMQKNENRVPSLYVLEAYVSSTSDLERAANEKQLVVVREDWLDENPNHGRRKKARM